MKLKLIIIEWIDASYTENVDLSKDGIELAVVQPSLSIQTGFLVKETEDYIAFASVFIPFFCQGHHLKFDSRPDLLHDQLRDVYTIPRHYIQNIEIIREFDSEDFVKTKVRWGSKKNE